MLALSVTHLYTDKSAWVALYANTLNPNCLSSVLNSKSQSPLCYSAGLIPNMVYLNFFHILFVRIKRDQPVK